MIAVRHAVSDGPVSGPSRHLGADTDAAVPRDARGPHPLCASYHARLAARSETRIDAGALRVIDALADLEVRDIGPDELAPFDPDGRLLLNVNTPDDYARALPSMSPHATGERNHKSRIIDPNRQ